MTIKTVAKMIAKQMPDGLPKNTVPTNRAQRRAAAKAKKEGV